MIIKSQTFEQPFNADNDWDDSISEDEGRTDPSLVFDPLNSPIILSHDELNDIAKPLAAIPVRDEHPRHVALEVVYTGEKYSLLFFFFRSKEAYYIDVEDVCKGDTAAKTLLSSKRISALLSLLSFTYIWFQGACSVFHIFGRQAGVSG